MENPVEYINQRMKVRMLVISEGMQRGLLTTSELADGIPLCANMAKNCKDEETIYDALAELIVTSTTPFSITNYACLEKASEAYREIIPLIKDRAVRTLANHCLSATQANLGNLEKLSKVIELNKRLGFEI